MTQLRSLRYALGLALVVVGSLVWNSRLDYSPESQVGVQLSDPLVSGALTDLSRECAALSADENWILFVVSATLVSDTTPRRYFQTSADPFGMFIEYDPGESAMLRLGLGLGPDQWNTALPIRFVRRAEAAFIAVGISRNETRIVSNVVDRRIRWPAEFLPQLRCDQVRVGSKNSSAESGVECVGCTVAVRHASGEGIEKLNDILDALSNVREYQMKRWLGTTMVLAGCAVVLVPFGQRLRKPNRQADES